MTSPLYIHVPGKHIYTADTLPRSPSNTTENDVRLQEKAGAMMEAYVHHLPASMERLDKYWEMKAEDHMCSSVIDYCRKGWPEKNIIKAAQGDLPVDKDNLLFYGKCIVVPKALQKEKLKMIHEGHQRAQRCRRHTNISVWWPGLSPEVQTMVTQGSQWARDLHPLFSTS